jgi:hypothetical protein
MQVKTLKIRSVSMQSKSIFLAGVILSLIVAGLAFAQVGQHNGEKKQLDVQIAFSDAVGKTVTNATGTHYYVGSGVSSENKVYPSQYWGTYPLYYFGSRVGVQVTVTNLGPRQKAKIRITTEGYALLTSGASGGALFSPRQLEVEVAKGETKTIDASFVTEYTASSESGLDRFLVKVSHLAQGGGPGNETPSLIMVKEGVFCPPKPDTF